MPQFTQCATCAAADWLDQTSAINNVGVPQDTGKVTVTPFNMNKAEPSGKSWCSIEPTVVKGTHGSGVYSVSNSGTGRLLLIAIFRNGAPLALRSAASGACITPFMVDSPFTH